MTRLKFIFSSALAGFVLTGCAASQTGNAPAFIAYPEGGEYRLLEPDVNLDASAETDLVRFRDGEAGLYSRYFAAYAWSPAGPRARAGDFNRLETAKAVAVERCQQRLATAKDAQLLPDEAPPCRVIAIIVPTGYEPTTAVTLGEGASNGYRRYLERLPPKAFAVGDKTGWASNHNAKSLEWARERALKTCLEHGVYPESQLPTGEQCELISEDEGPVDE